MTTRRAECVFMAKLAEQAERYDEMTDFMKEVVLMDQELSVEDRNLLSVAYKNAVGTRRASWRVISTVEQKEKSRTNEENRKQTEEYRKKVEKELSCICDEILNLLSEHLIKNSTSLDAKVFYHKMKGDYFRYISEFTTGDKKEKASKEAHDTYNEASTLASQLPTTHPIRLGLALNYSVFHYEILSNADEACRIAKHAFEEAIGDLDNANEESYKDSTLIMQLLRDNLTLWTTDNAAEENGENKGGETSAQ
eukprot:GHVL01031910.1.p1 GENE.GHVL01031910.1~~GHVL01031910.1.p1  ORF type:complete len:252 (+),score=37.96 GHVL01031910.1:139-894(+)